MNPSLDDQQRNTLQEVQRIAIEETARSQSEIRSRIATLSSVIFSLSLFAVQLSNVNGGWVIVSAWILLAISLIGSVLSTFVAAQNNEVTTFGVFKVLHGTSADGKINSSIWNKFDSFLQYSTALLLAIAIVLLVVFASNNLPDTN